jgi:hypothetical protein
MAIVSEKKGYKIITWIYIYENRIYNRKILNKKTEIYIAERNGNLIKPLLSLPFMVKLLRCPTDQQIPYFN